MKPVRWIAAIVAACLCGHVPAAGAQQHPHAATPPAGAPDAVAPGDSRSLVTLPAPMRAHTLANMRDHLLALQEIDVALANSDYDGAAKVAESRLGMSSLEAHGAAHLAPFMPKGMQEIGSEMHRAASRFAVEAQNASVSNDPRPALAALGGVMQQCVACHAAYRLH